LDFAGPEKLYGMSLTTERISECGAGDTVRGARS